jgi:Tol biopolymer transport system component
MAELKEIFEMVTHDTEPNLDAWEEQERRQRATARRRRAAALGVAAVILILLGVFAVASLRGSGTDTPADEPVAPLVSSTDLVGLDVESGASHVLVRDVAPFGATQAPDGRQLAYERVTDGHPQIFVSALDGTHAQQVTGLPSQQGCACGAIDPTWIDGSTLAFVGILESGNHRIYVLDLSSGRIQPVRHGSGQTWDVAPSWAPGSDRLAYAEGSWNAVPPGSGTILMTVLTGRVNPTRVVAQRGATAPDASPDGLRIAYQAATDGGTSLFVADENGTTRLTDGPDDTAPAWSPDATRIAFVRGGSVAILTVATGDVRELGHGGDPSWSADGSTIFAWTAG